MIMPDTLVGKLDRVLLRLGFAAAMRRSEIVDLDVADIERTSEGLLVRIKRSKTDQEGAGQVVAVPHGRKLQPVAALDAWLAAAAIDDGPLFRRVRKNGSLLPSRLTHPSVAVVSQRHAA